MQVATSLYYYYYYHLPSIFHEKSELKEKMSAWTLTPSIRFKDHRTRKGPQKWSSSSGFGSIKTDQPRTNTKMQTHMILSDKRNQQKENESAPSYLRRQKKKPRKSNKERQKEMKSPKQNYRKTEKLGGRIGPFLALSHRWMRQNHHIAIVTDKKRDSGRAKYWEEEDRECQFQRNLSVSATIGDLGFCTRRMIRCSVSKETLLRQRSYHRPFRELPAMPDGQRCGVGQRGSRDFSQFVTLPLFFWAQCQ